MSDALLPKWRYSVLPTTKRDKVRLPKPPRMHGPSSIRLWEKYQELRETEQALERLKKSNQSRMEKLREKREQIEAKSNAFKAYMARMSKFVEDAVKKKEEALSRARAEMKATKTRTGRSKELRWQLLRYKLLRQRTLFILKKYTNLRDYVHQLIGENEMFPTFEHMIHRHRSLVLTLRDLKIEDQLRDERLWKLKHNLVTYIRFTEIKNMKINCRITREGVHLDRLQSDIARMEAMWSNFAHTASNFCLTIGYVKMATRDLCKKVLGIHEEGQPPTEDFDEQMSEIMRFMETHGMAYNE